MEAWQDFGQKVDLTARIREILLNYPEGTSILKELVQNADDARASVVKFCVDCRTHGTESLLAPAMAAFQGPALLAYNDGVFSERDLESISRIGDSKKKEEQGKTGRFGVGFNSCYHLTDVPSFVSGRHLVIFDPHCRHLPNISSTNPGKRIDFVEHSEVAAQYRDQAAPFAGVFGCTLGVAGAAAGPWQGTLFRFPLRSGELAVKSTISKQVYTPESIRALLGQLCVEAFQILLFLKHVGRIEVHEWPAGAPAPRLLFAAAVSNPSPALAAARGLFARVSGDKPPASGQPLPEVFSTYRLELTREWYQGGSGGAAAGATAPDKPGSGLREQRSYIVAQVRGGGEVASVAEQLSRHFGVPLVPWGAVAADVTAAADAGGEAGEAGAEAGAAGLREEGRAFCFLPLPAKTGLPVHVNGYFELSSNRRDIWHGEDMAGSGARRAAWNVLLLERVIAVAYVAALTEAAAVLGPGPAYDRLWPAAAVAAPWHTLLIALYRLVSGEEVCWSTSRGGRWVAPRAGVLRDAAAEASPALAAALVEAAGLPLLELPAGVADLMKVHMVEKPRVCSPALARQALAEAAAARTSAPGTPRPSSPGPAPGADPDPALRTHASPLLDYCLSDLDTRQHVAQAAAQLAGLRLLPLLDGTTAAFVAGRGSGGGRQHQVKGPLSGPPSCYYLPTDEEKELLVRTGGLLVDSSGLGAPARGKLATLASARVLNLSPLEPQDMASVVLPRILPATWLSPSGRVVDWQADEAAEASGVTGEWLQHLWRWISSHGALAPFLGLPILPILGGRLAPLADPATSTAVLPPTHGSLPGRGASVAPAITLASDAAGAGTPAVAVPASASNTLEQFTEVLTQLGLQLADSPAFTLPLSDLLRGGHVHLCDGPGLLAALHRLSVATHTPPSPGRSLEPPPSPEGGGRGRSLLSVALAARVSALAAEDKRMLRSVLLTEECLGALSGRHGQNPQPGRQGGSDGGQRPPLQPNEARALLLLLASLPIYESARGAAGGDGAGGSEPQFMPLVGAGACFLAPPGVDVRVLGALSGGYVVAGSEAEGRLMVAHLGVRGITAAEAYRSHILPGLASLPAPLRDAAVLGVLRGLPALGAQDRGFTVWLRAVHFVPNNKGELHTPGELYDPRNADLAALLDPEADFPAATLLLQAAGASQSQSQLQGLEAAASGAAAAGGLSEDEGRGGGGGGGSVSDVGASSMRSGGGAGAGDASLVLYMLQQLGLRTAASMDTLLRAARFVERTADAAASASVVAAAGEAGPEAAAAAGDDDADMAIARGKALLAYLDAEAARIMGPVGATPAIAGGMPAATGTSSAASSATPAQPGPGGAARKFAAGLFSRARELFGQQGGHEQPAPSEVHSFWEALARIRWCPVIALPPAPGLPWPSGAVPRLAAPRTVRPAADMWLCSSCLYLADGECRSSALAAGLGWSAPLGGSVLATQLLQLGELHIRVEDPALSQVLAGVVPLLYRSLAALPPAEAAVARSLLHGSRCVWVGNGFAQADRVAFRGSLDLSPWLYVMPAELAPFKDLLLSFGAADAFSAVQYCSVLADVAAATGADGGGGADGLSATPQPLSEAQLGQVVAVAQALADLTLPPGAAVWLPDERGVLARAPDLAFNDAPWLAGQPACASVRLVHARISAHVAARLGAPSLRRLLLAASADSVALGTVGGAEAFGQSEALTTRLRHIIGDYPEGPGVLMELLQNADDAGASSLQLLLDCGAYPTASILSPGMAVWQGPALLVANDALFSPTDFTNIARIGQDSKASRPTAIGRFGLGFNAVYHFTDLPCFVSGDYLVMFDPHAKYLPGVSAAQPGLKIAFARAQLLRQFPDAFTPFTHLGCTMQEHYRGTLFRFPLRGPAAAAQSDIKSTPCSTAEVMQLLESFRRQLPSAMLFLKNIRSVTAYVRTADGSTTIASAPPSKSGGGAGADAGAPGVENIGALTADAPGPQADAKVRLLFRATREPVSPEAPVPGSAEAGTGMMLTEGSQPAGQDMLQSAITRFIAGTPTDPVDLPTFYKRLAATQPQALPAQLGPMRLDLHTYYLPSRTALAGAAEAGSAAPGDVAGGLAPDGSSSSGLALVTAAARASTGGAGSGGGSGAEAEGEAGWRGEVSERWLVCNLLAGGAAREVAVRSYRATGAKMVPWVGVAARLDGEGGGRDKERGADGGGAAVAGRAFCFLPLPIRTGLPVHVNGYFELSSNRRDIWYGGDMSGSGAVRSSWNVALLADGLAPAYGRLLVAVARQAGPGPQLYRLLPSLDTPEPWSHLVGALYGSCLGDLPIVYTHAGGGRWLTPRTVLFSDAACAAEPLLRSLLVGLGMPLACDMPPEAEAALLRGTPGTTAISPAHVRHHLAAALRASGGDAAALSAQIAAAAAGAAKKQQDKAHRASDVGEAAHASTGPAVGAAVAMLLRYCLSDLDPSQPARAAALAAELDGLPLLPLADGTMGRLAQVSQAQAGRGRRNSVSGGLAAGHHVYVLTRGSLELELLAALRGRCVAPGLPQPLDALLQQVADLGMLNVRRLSPALLDSALLPLLLPPHWQGAPEVEWQPPDARPAAPAAPATAPPPGASASAPADQPTTAATPPQAPAAPQLAAASEPSAEWLRNLWRWLGERPDVLDLASWPVLPIQGGRLGRLAGAGQSLVLREGDWTEAVTGALLRLGCRLLDGALLPPGAASSASPAMQACVQQPSLGGVLGAIAAAKAAAGPEAAATQDRRPQLWQPGAQAAAGLAAVATLGGGASWSARLAALSAVERRQLRAYLLQGRWFAKGSPTLPVEQLDLLRSLPLYEIHPDPQPGTQPPPSAAPGAPAPTPTTRAASPASSSSPAAIIITTTAAAPDAQLALFTSLDLQRHRLAPPGTDPRVLSSAFLRAESPAEEVLLEHALGVARLGLPELLRGHVGPAAGLLPREALEAWVAGLLAGVEALMAAGPEGAALRAAFNEHPLVPSAAPSRELRRPTDLHDPRVAALAGLLPSASAFFPAPSLAASPRLLDSLAALGMVRRLDLGVMVTAARALDSDHARWVGQDAAGAARTVQASVQERGFTAEELRRRGGAILHQLEEWVKAHGAAAGAGGGSARGEEEAQRAAAWQALAGLCWCPVVQEAPEAGLPWPASQPLLAPPRLVRPPTDAWLVSATLHMLDTGAALPAAAGRPGAVSKGLATALGWAVDPRVSVLAAQLLELGRMHALRPPPLKSAAQQPSGQAAEEAGSSTSALHHPTEAAAETVESGKALSSSAAAGSEALLPSPAAGSSPQQPAADAEATSQARAAAAAAESAAALARALDRAVHRLYGALSAALDGPEGDLVTMSFERPDTPCVWVGQGFVAPGSAALRSEGDFRPYLWPVPEPLHEYGRLLSLMGVRDRFTAQHFATGLAALTATADGAPLDDTSLALALQLADCAAEAVLHYGRPTGQAVPFYVPDSAGVMAPAASAFFNDAEWIDSRDLVLVHGALPAATAEALGVRSLRHAHEVEAQLTASLPCPSPAELRERLGLTAQAEVSASGPPSEPGPAAALCFLLELLEAADCLGVRGLRLALDTRQHPDQSLLAPGLAQFQGPALCAVLPECVLGPEELAALLAGRGGGAGQQPALLRGRPAAYCAGLQAAFLVTELLQVVSGSSTYMWDPSGAYLGGAAGGGGGGRGRGGATPRAKQYVHVSSDLLTTFADQFAVWSFADGYDIRAHVPATLLRLPLRRAGGAQGGGGLRGGGLACASLESVEAALRVFVAQGPRSLLFLQSLTGMEVSVLRPRLPSPVTKPLQEGSHGRKAAEEERQHDPQQQQPQQQQAPHPQGRVAADRELLLQASLVQLDAERPRPEYSGAGAAVRQRPVGPGASLGKALVALGRSLVRGHSEGGVRQQLVPLELHVCAANALLMPLEGTGGGGRSGGGDSSASGGGGETKGGGKQAQGQTPGGSAKAAPAPSLAAGGEELGSTLYRERWLLSCYHDTEGVALSPAAAAAAGHGGATRLELAAAAAVCIARDEERDLYPVSGLFAPVYLPPPQLSAGPASAQEPQHTRPPGSSLGRMPFLVFGNFYLSRHGGKHIISPFTRAEAAAGPASPRAGSAPAAGAGALPPLLAHRCEHNRRVLDAAAQAWQALAAHLCSPDQYAGPRGRLYDVFPDMAAAAAPPPDEAALYCVRQMYGAAGRLPLWRLRTGRFVHLPEGCFLQDGTEGLGPAAMGFMARQMPLFDVPWVVKQHLEAADVHGLRAVSPAVVRPLLRSLGRRAGAVGAGASAGGAAAKPAWPGLTVLEATELLQFCSGDLRLDDGEVAAAAAAAAAMAAGTAGGARASPGVGGGAGATAGGPGTAAAMGTLIDGLASQMRTVVGELVGPALYDQLRQQALGLLPSATSPGGTQQQQAPQPAPVVPHYHSARLNDCRGLPVPTASGGTEALGSVTLLAAPPLPAAGGRPPVSPTGLLPPQCAAEFVHPDCVARMAEHFRDPQYRTCLALRPYTLSDLARHLRTALPPGWDHPLAAPCAAGPASHPLQPQLGRAWDGGADYKSDGPSGLWLWQLWALINGIVDAAAAWQVPGPESSLDTLSDWPLLPALGPGRGAGQLLPTRHAGLAVVLPQPQQPEQPQEQGKQPAGKAAASGVASAAAEEGAAAAAGQVPGLDELAPTLPQPWPWLAPALHAAGCPLLDPRFAPVAARHCGPQPAGLPPRSLAEAAAAPAQPSRSTRGSAGQVASQAVAALVAKMRRCDEEMGGGVAVACGAAWDGPTRTALLGLLAEAAAGSLDAPDLPFLRRLPIYPTHMGGHIALEGPAGAAEQAEEAEGGAAEGAEGEGEVGGSGPVVASADLLELVPGLVPALPPAVLRRLLVPLPGASALYTALSLVPLAPPAFLAAVALPALRRGALPEAVRDALLQHVQAHWPKLRADESLLAALRTTPFVLTGSGARQPPPALFDPEQPLFAAAFRGPAAAAAFPAGPFASPAWLALLRECGLQHRLTPAALEAAARAVAARGAELGLAAGEALPGDGDSMEDPLLPDGAAEVPPAVATARSQALAAGGALVAALGAQAGALTGCGREWWAGLARLAFVPATLGLPGSRRARQVLAPYAAAALAADWALVWSVRPLLPPPSQPPTALAAHLRVRSPPPFADVMAHVRRLGADGGEAALGAWPPSAGGVEEAGRALLAYLDREGVEGDKAVQLRELAFVPVARGTLLAPPSRLFVRLKVDLSPLAFEIPPTFASFAPLLKSLGARDEPTTQDLLSLLHSLHRSAAGRPLSPGQRSACLRLLRCLTDPAADRAALAAARRERRLLALAADGRLLPAHTAVAVGGEGCSPAGAAGRLLGRLDPRSLTLAHPGLGPEAAVWLGCPALEEVAEERLEAGGGELQPVAEIQGLSLAAARQRLASPAFAAAAHALLRSHASLLRGAGPAAGVAGPAGGGGPRPRSLHEVAALLRAAAGRLTFVRGLRTVAVLKTTGAALTPDAEAARAVFDFVEPPPATPASGSPAGPALPFGRILLAAPPAELCLPVSWLLAGCVSRVLGSPVVLPLQPLFSVPAEQLAALQPVLLPGGFDAGLEAAAAAGTPGAPLLPADAALLALRPLRRYCAGEVVAVRAERAEAEGVAAAEAAAAAERRWRAAGGGEVAPGGGSDPWVGDSGGGGGGGMVYGRVAADCAPPSSGPSAVYRVAVEVEPGVVRHVLSTQVFAFRNPSGSGRDATTPAPASEPEAAAAPVPTSAAPPSASPAATQPAAAPSAPGPVRAAELVSAVRDVLAAAGLPLEPAAGPLMGRVAALREEVEALGGQLAEAQRAAAAAASEAEAARGAWQCKICFSREVDAAYTGCGHTVCSGCATAAASNRCPVCRKPSANLLRLYRA